MPIPWKREDSAVQIVGYVLAIVAVSAFSLWAWAQFIRWVV